MDKTVYDIHSEKYDVDGQVLDYGMVIKLEFIYEGRAHSIGLARPFQEELADAGLRTMERTIENLLSGGASRNPMLFKWYVDTWADSMIAHGVVTGHRKLPDTMFINTSPVKDIEIDSERGEAVIVTMNTIYCCPLNSLSFSKQDENPELIPGYEAVKEKFSVPVEDPEIEQGKILLVLSDHDEYYFHSLCVRDKDGKPLSYSAHPHIGTFQDSFLIHTADLKIDLCYFPHFRNISFYSSRTDNMPLYAENIGSGVIYIRFGGYTFKLDPGIRMELCEENAMGDVPDLPNGDLYPAGILE